LNAPEAKEFVLFKKKLYQAYEACNRSVNEHNELTGKVSLDQLYHIIDSNNRHLAEIRSQNSLDRLYQQIYLKGKVY
jgi:hypothetical protein